MTTNSLKVAMILLSSIALLQGPLLTGQGHYDGCYDEICDSFERCWSNSATTYCKAELKCEADFWDGIEQCDEDFPHSTHARFICYVGVDNKWEDCMYLARKAYCQDKKDCCNKLRPRNPHPGSIPCYYYDSNCPAGCSG